MSEKIKARLSDIKEAVSDNWFVDNPNSSEVNEEITVLIYALEVAVRRLASIEEFVSESFEDTGDYDSHSTQWVCPFCNTRYEHDDDCEAKLIAEDLKQIEARLGGE